MLRSLLILLWSLLLDTHEGDDEPENDEDQQNDDDIRNPAAKIASM
jgi:hypothetical protein